jgi:hypothetical protein
MPHPSIGSRHPRWPLHEFVSKDSLAVTPVWLENTGTRGAVWATATIALRAALYDGIGRSAFSIARH